MKTAAIGKKWKRNESHLEGLNGSLATAIVQAGMGQFVQRGKETSWVKVVTNNLDSKKAVVQLSCALEVVNRGTAEEAEATSEGGC